MAAQLTPDGALSQGQTLGRYIILRPLGSTHQGVVHEALELPAERPVALEVLAPYLAARPASRARFLSESSALARIRRPHLLAVLDVGEQDGVVFRATAWLQGEDLSRVISRGAVPPLALAALLVPVALALSTCHDQGVLHRDVNPQHFLLSSETDGRKSLVLTGFGFGRLATEFDGGRLLGNPAYLAPECLGPSPSFDARSDQYAFGVTLHACLTGRQPFVDGGANLVFSIVMGRFPRPRELAPSLSERLEDVVLRAMQVDPTARFASLGELARALRAALENSGAAA